MNIIKTNSTSLFNFLNTAISHSSAKPVAALAAGALGIALFRAWQPSPPLPPTTLVPQKGALATLAACVSHATQHFFFILATPYYFLLGEKEWALNNLPTPIHYNKFNTSAWLGGKAPLAHSIRQEAIKFLSALGAVSFSNQLYSGSSIPQLPGWSGINLSKVADDKLVRCAKMVFTGKELKHMAASLRVSYDWKVIFPWTLSSILCYGANSSATEQKARGRMVSSLVASVYDSCGNALERTSEQLPMYRVYTSNAPNLAYHPQDQAGFTLPNGQLDKQKYQAEIQRILNHFVQEAKKNGDDTLVLCGFGLGAFMLPQFSQQATACFAQALKEVISSNKESFKQFIFADPNSSLTHRLQGISDLVISHKSCLDVAHFKATQGRTVALFNPGDGSGIPGQFWLNGHIALEEMFGLFTTLLISQHPHCNPQVGKWWNYYAH